MPTPHRLKETKRALGTGMRISQSKILRVPVFMSQLVVLAKKCPIVSRASPKLINHDHLGNSDTGTRQPCHIMLWLAPWAGKMNQILRCDWPPERARWSYLAKFPILTSHLVNNPHLLPSSCTAFFQAITVNLSKLRRTARNRSHFFLWPTWLENDWPRRNISGLRTRQVTSLVYRWRVDPIINGQKSWDTFAFLALLALLGTRQTRIQLHLPKLVPYPPYSVKNYYLQFRMIFDIVSGGEGKSNAFFKEKQRFFQFSVVKHIR